MTILRQSKLKIAESGFTLIELIVVMVVIAIAALLAVPMISSAADVQVSSAAHMIAADLEYAKSLAMTSQQNYSVAFDPGNDSYEIRNTDGNVIDHPLKAGSLFTINLQNEGAVKHVDITAADFDSQTAVTFNYLGSPYSGTTTANPLNAGTISLAARQFTMDIEVTPVTGSIKIIVPYQE